MTIIIQVGLAIVALLVQLLLVLLACLVFEPTPHLSRAHLSGGFSNPAVNWISTSVVGNRAEYC